MWKLSFALDSTRKLEFKSDGHLREAVARRIQLNLNIIIPILFLTCAMKIIAKDVIIRHHQFVSSYLPLTLVHH